MDPRKPGALASVSINLPLPCLSQAPVRQTDTYVSTIQQVSLHQPWRSSVLPPAGNSSVPLVKLMLLSLLPPHP